MEIEDFPDYLIHNDGRVENKKTGRILKPNLRPNGYLTIQFTQNRSVRYVHRLVAQSYIPNPENKPEVDHINRNRHDNRTENLRWATHSENMLNKNLKGYCRFYKNGWEISWQIEPNKSKTKRFSTEKEAREYLEAQLMLRRGTSWLTGM